MWHGKVDASSDSGKATSVHLKKGEPISILAKGWVDFGDGWAAPEGPNPTWKSATGSKASHTLVARIGGDKKTYPVGNGLFDWHAPAAGQLFFLFDDAPGTYGDNKGSFDVTVWRGKPVAWSGTLEASSEKGVPTGVTVSKGDAISIAVAGTTNFGGGYPDCGPDGSPAWTSPKLELASANIGAVLMQIGKGGSLRLVGSEWSGAAEDDGEIVFFYNDVPGDFGDNTGSYEITLTA